MIFTLVHVAVGVVALIVILMVVGPFVWHRVWPEKPASSGVLPPGYEWVADIVDISHFLLVDDRGRVRAAVRGWTDGRGGWGSTMLVGSWPEPALAMAATVGAMERAGWELRTVVIDPAAAPVPLTSSESPSG